MSVAVASKSIGPSTSGVRPWPRRSGEYTRNRAAYVARTGSSSSASLNPPCRYTSGSPAPSTAYQVRTPPRSTVVSTGWN